MKHNYFIASDEIDYTDNGKNIFDVNVYDLSLFNGETADLDYMIVNTEHNKEDSPTAPYTAEQNEFYNNNKEDFIDRDVDHSPREMVEILLEVAKTKPFDSITKDDIKETLESVRESFRKSHVK